MIYSLRKSFGCLTAGEGDMCIFFSILIVAFKGINYRQKCCRLTELVIDLQRLMCVMLCIFKLKVVKIQLCKIVVGRRVFLVVLDGKARVCNCIVKVSECGMQTAEISEYGR